MIRPSSLPLARPGLLALVLAATTPALALAHPLGNFTINHYAGIRVAPGRIDLDVVLDLAEIPAFTEQGRIDSDGDGTVSPTELETERSVACARLEPSLALDVGGVRLPLTVVAAGVSLPPGAAGLSTLRIVCEFRASLDNLGSGTPVSFADTSYAERIGWREVVVTGDGVTVEGPGVAATGVSNRLTAYPADLLVQPLNVRSVSFTASAGGPRGAPWTAPDATPLAASGDAATTAAGSATSALPELAAVPGGVTDELRGLVAQPDLSLPVIVASLLVALGLGAAHALSPGHGKTVMAAYLVGTRGTARHAVGLGLAVTVSHTLGVFGLAVLTVAASSIVAPDRLYPVLGLVSGAIVLAIGARLLVSRLRWRTGPRTGDVHDHRHPAADGHDHRPAAADERGDLSDIPAGGAGAVEYGLAHGAADHAHVDSALGWRALVALGLAGGLVPSASALILLLGSISAGRPSWGLVLVVAFGAGMAIVLGGVGLALVYAGRTLERTSSSPRLRWLPGAVPWATAVVVLGVGAFMTAQGIAALR